jgi:hypothetical protein
VFERVLLAVSEMHEPTWKAARAKLEATALIRADQKLTLAGGPYLQFHPTLTYAADDGGATAEAKNRYIGVYLAVMRAVDQAITGPYPREAMQLMFQEEANFRKAMVWALEQGAYEDASTATWAGRTMR